MKTSTPLGFVARRPIAALGIWAVAMTLLPALDCSGGSGSTLTSGSTPGTCADLAAAAAKVLATVQNAVYFAPAACTSAGADGTASRPFPATALTVKAGQTLVLLPGDYAVPVTLPGGAHLLVPEPKLTIVRATVKVEGKGASSVQGLRSTGAAGAGVQIRSADVTLKDVRIVDVVAKAGAGAGHGVEVRDGGSLAASSLAVIGSAGVGVLAKGAGAISIVEPIFDVDPRGDDGKIGIVEPIFAPSTQIAGNEGGGIAIVEPIFFPKSDSAADGGLTLTGAWVRDNAGFAVALYGASATLSRVALTGTVRGAKGKWADGVLLAPGAKGAPIPTLRIDERCVISDNVRGGVVALTEAKVEVAADVSGNGYAGLWIGAKGAKLDVGPKARLFRNHLVAVCVAEGAELLLQGAELGETRPLSVDGGDDVGDGIGVFSGARATIKGARIVDNTRAAVLVHAAATLSDGTPDVSIDGTTFVGGKYAVVVNGAPAPDFASKNSYEPSMSEGSGTSSGGADGGAASGDASQPKDAVGAPSGDTPDDRDNAALPVETEYCESGDECAPAGDSY